MKRALLRKVEVLFYVEESEVWKKVQTVCYNVRD